MCLFGFSTLEETFVPIECWNATKVSHTDSRYGRTGVQGKIMEIITSNSRSMRINLIKTYKILAEIYRIETWMNFPAGCLLSLRRLSLKFRDQMLRTELRREFLHPEVSEVLGLPPRGNTRAEYTFFLMDKKYYITSLRLLQLLSKFGRSR